MPSIFRSMTAVSAIGLALAVALTGCAGGPAASDARSSETVPQDARIAPYHARFGRSQALVAVVGDNRGTELTDYVVPYGILAQSRVAQVLAVSTNEGPIRTTTSMGLPSFQIQAEASIAQFDTRFPDGADYVVVPATRGDAALIAWIAQQAARGATIVSICNGSQIVAKSAAMHGHRPLVDASRADEGAARGALGQEHALHGRPELGLERRRQCVDSRLDRAGGSDSRPPARGRPGVRAGGRRLERSPRQRCVSAPLRPQPERALATTLYTNGWFHRRERIGVPVAAGVDEVALALTVDAYSSTGRSQALIVADNQAPLRTRHGPLLIPDSTTGQTSQFDRVLPPMGDTPSAAVLDQALAGIALSYGKTTASGVAMVLEYPGLHQ